MLSIDFEEKIYNKKIQKYFNEVISSYINENYRSANVMLYSVVICDLLYKLEELKDEFNDKKASTILTKIEKDRRDKNKTKSEWENGLINEVYKNTEIINDELLSHIARLKDDRNFSSHPALNDDYSLIEPSKEATIANIKNMLNGLLSKPPVIVSTICDYFLEDIKNKKDTYIENYDDFKKYLTNKYYSKMSENVTIKLFKSMWKICFGIDNDDCNENRAINCLALRTLTDVKNADILTKMVDITDLDYIENKYCKNYLIFYLSYYPVFYTKLSDDAKFRIEKFCNDNEYAKVLSWFINNDFEEHLKKMIIEIKPGHLYDEVISRLYDESEKTGNIKLFTNFCIEYYDKVKNYDNADSVYIHIISKYMHIFDKEDFEKLFSTINSNNQIYGRWAAYDSNSIIIKTYITKYGNDYDKNKYPNIKFNEKILDIENDGDIQNDNEEEFELL